MALADEIRQMLVQAVLAYEQDPTRDSYRAYVVGMDGTTLQLSVGTVTRIYLEGLSQGKSLDNNLYISCSEKYDLRECGRRREALKLIIGFLRALLER